MDASSDSPGPSLREDVEALAQLRRLTTTAGERESAEWVAGRLRALGTEGVRIVTFRGQSSWAWAHGAHMLAGLAEADSWSRRRLLGALVAVRMSSTSAFEASGFGEFCPGARVTRSRRASRVKILRGARWFWSPIMTLLRPG